MQCRARSKHFARHTLALDVYHLESSSLQLKNRSTLGLQQKLILKLYRILLFIRGEKFRVFRGLLSKRETL